MKPNGPATPRTTAVQPGNILVEVAEGRFRHVMPLEEFRDLAGCSWFRPGALARLEFESRFRSIDVVCREVSEYTYPPIGVELARHRLRRQRRN